MGNNSIDTDHWDYTPEMQRVTCQKSDEYKRELTFIARFFNQKYMQLRIWFPFLFMSYKTAAVIMRQYGEAEYKRGKADGIDA
jgi:hypothetical protein